MAHRDLPRRPRPALPRTAAALILAIAGGLVSVLPTGSAVAQLSAAVEPFEAYKIVTTDERAMVRCGPGAAYYPVAEALPVGFVLTADGETASGWLRVRYPTDSTALVSADSVELRSGNETAVLLRPAPLSAFNVSTGARGSWSKLLAEPLPAGTELTVVREAFNDLTGELVGYEVEPPEEARAFIRGSFTRRATSADLENAPSLAAGAPSAGGEAQAPASTETLAEAGEEDEADAPAQPPAPTGGQGRSTAAPSVASTETSRPVAARPVTQPLRPAGQPAAQPATEPVAEQPAGDMPAADASEVAAPPLTIRSLEDLEAAFAAVQAQPLADAEFDQLVAEVERMLEAEGPASPLRPAIESRLGVLKIRQRVQEAWRANEQAAREAESTASELSSEIRRLEIERSYSAIGRLLPSAVYDGQRLPRMFRVQSVDTTEAPRTLGYIRPDPRLGLETMLNQTVGVVGTPRLDPRLNLLIIEPVKIDVIGASGN